MVTCLYDFGASRVEAEALIWAWKLIVPPPFKGPERRLCAFALELPERFRLRDVVAVGLLQSRVSGFDPAYIHGNMPAIVEVFVDGHFAPDPLPANPQRGFALRRAFDPNLVCRHLCLP